MIQRLTQRMRQTAHSARERGPDIFLVLLVVLVLASATGVAQESLLFEGDFEDGTIEDWESDLSDADGASNVQVDGQRMLYPGQNAYIPTEFERDNFRMEGTAYLSDSGFLFISFGNRTGAENPTIRLDTQANTVELSNYEQQETDTPSDFNGLSTGTYYEYIFVGNDTGFHAKVGDWEWMSVSHGNGPVEARPSLDNGRYDMYISEYEYWGLSNPDSLPPYAFDESLSIETRDLYQPGYTHEYTVYHNNYSIDEGRNVSQDVTENATVTTDSSLLTVNDNQTMTATAGENESAVVNVTAEYEGENTTKQVVVARPTVQNLEILPTGITRVWAVGTDNTIFALLIAAFMGVAATRYAGAFAGLATAEMVIVIGWLGGYVGLGMAMVSIFMAMFIGLNLAANIDYSVSRR